MPKFEDPGPKPQPKKEVKVDVELPKRDEKLKDEVDKLVKEQPHDLEKIPNKTVHDEVVDDMEDAGLIEFIPTTFIRGLTWDNAIVIIDEGQNMTFHEINSIMTRLGTHSKVIFTGDLPQSDLTRRNDVSGMQQFLDIACTMNDFDCVHFTTNDIVRSDFVKSWIVASEAVGQ